MPKGADYQQAATEIYAKLSAKVQELRERKSELRKSGADKDFVFDVETRIDTVQSCMKMIYNDFNLHSAI